MRPAPLLALALLSGACLDPGKKSPYGAVDGTPPDVIATSPANGQRGVDYYVPDAGADALHVDVTFSELMDHRTLESQCLGSSVETGVCGPAMFLRFSTTGAANGRVDGFLRAEDVDGPPDPNGGPAPRLTVLHFQPSHWKALADAAAGQELRLDAFVSGAVTDRTGNKMGHDAHFSFFTLKR